MIMIIIFIFSLIQAINHHGVNISKFLLSFFDQEKCLIVIKLIMDIHIFYKQPHFRDEPRVAIKIPKMRPKDVTKYFGIEAQGC